MQIGWEQCLHQCSSEMWENTGLVLLQVRKTNGLLHPRQQLAIQKTSFRPPMDQQRAKIRCIGKGAPHLSLVWREWASPPPHILTSPPPRPSTTDKGLTGEREHLLVLSYQSLRQNRSWVQSNFDLEKLFSSEILLFRLIVRKLWLQGTFPPNGMKNCLLRWLGRQEALSIPINHLWSSKQFSFFTTGWHLLGIYCQAASAPQNSREKNQESHQIPRWLFSRNRHRSAPCLQRSSSCPEMEPPLCT